MVTYICHESLRGYPVVGKYDGATLGLPVVEETQRARDIWSSIIHSKLLTFGSPYFVTREINEKINENK